MHLLFILIALQSMSGCKCQVILVILMVIILMTSSKHHICNEDGNRPTFSLLPYCQYNKDESFGNLNSERNQWFISEFSSCRHRCGQRVSVNKLCSCDTLCQFYKDCCFDFNIHCQNEFNRSMVRQGHDEKHYTACKQLNNINSNISIVSDIRNTFIK